MLGNRLKAALSDTLDVFFPPTCIGCRGVVDGGGFRYICDGCARKIVIAEAPRCTTCGYPFFGALAESQGCGHCVELDPRFNEGRTVALLQGPVRRLVHALKYDHAVHLVEDVARIVAKCPGFTDFLEDAVLVPVPLHPRKRRERGFNQAEVIAEIFAQLVPSVEVVPILERIIDTRTQTRLDRKSRHSNLKNAFALAPATPVVSGQRYVLIDDVFTTGSTLNACAQVLRRAGLTHIDAATLGHG